LKAKKVLIVDDNPTNAQILLHQTKSWGMLPDKYLSAEGALGSLKGKKNYDLVILDMQMPGMDGINMAKEIKKIPGRSELPLVMLTSIGKLSQVKSNDGGDIIAAYMAKPIKQSDLYNTLVEVFDKKRQNDNRRIKDQDKDGLFNRDLGRLQPLRILLAEDNVVNQKVAINILERIGYRVDVVANGIEAMEAIERQKYDVVLMDVQMPEMDGVTATNQIRQQVPSNRQPRIIAMTAHALEGDRELYIESGMDDYVSKPIKVNELIEALKRVNPISEE
jgi:CheY-like chemotaxis protein